MANFFKDYQAQVKAKREAEERAKQQPERKEYETGEVVMIDKRYDHTEKQTGRKYFVTYLKDHVLLADNKKQAMEGRGYIYDLSVIVA